MQKNACLNDKNFFNATSQAFVILNNGIKMQKSVLWYEVVFSFPV